MCFTHSSTHCTMLAICCPQTKCSHWHVQMPELPGFAPFSLASQPATTLVMYMTYMSQYKLKSLILVQTGLLICTKINHNSNFSWMFLSVSGNPSLSSDKLKSSLKYKLEETFLIVLLFIWSYVLCKRGFSWQNSKLTSRCLRVRSRLRALNKSPDSRHWWEWRDCPQRAAAGRSDCCFAYSTWTWKWLTPFGRVYKYHT